MAWEVICGIYLMVGHGDSVDTCNCNFGGPGVHHPLVGVRCIRQATGNIRTKGLLQHQSTRMQALDDEEMTKRSRAALLYGSFHVCPLLRSTSGIQDKISKATIIKFFIECCLSFKKKGGGGGSPTSMRRLAIPVLETLHTYNRQRLKKQHIQNQSSRTHVRHEMYRE